MAKSSLSSGELTNLLQSYLTVYAIIEDDVDFKKDFKAHMTYAFNDFLNVRFLPLKQSVPEDTTWLCNEVKALLENTILYLRTKSMVLDYSINFLNNPDGYLEIFLVLGTTRSKTENVHLNFAIGARRNAYRS